jgi:hypothetical protein
VAGYNLSVIYMDIPSGLPLSIVSIFCQAYRDVLAVVFGRLTDSYLDILLGVPR